MCMKELELVTIKLVIPVRSVCKDTKNYPKLVFGVMFMLFIVYAGYGSFVLLCYGDQLQKPLIIENFPQGIIFGSLIKLVYCFTLIVTIPLNLLPAHLVIEDYFYSKKRMTINQRTNYCRLNRTLLTGFSVLLAVLLGKKVDIFLALLGSFACIPVAFILPALFHYRICARTKQ